MADKDQPNMPIVEKLKKQAQTRNKAPSRHAFHEHD
jgi:hypothetical protein